MQKLILGPIHFTPGNLFYPIKPYRLALLHEQNSREIDEKVDGSADEMISNAKAEEEEELVAHAECVTTDESGVADGKVTAADGVAGDMGLNTGK